MDEYQTLINWAIGIGSAVAVIISGVASWLFKQLWNAVARLKEDLKKIEVDLPSTYVKQTNFDKIMERQDNDRHKEHDEVMSKLESIDGKFNRVYDKLEGKEDKKIN